MKKKHMNEPLQEHQPSRHRHPVGTGAGAAAGAVTGAAVGAVAAGPPGAVVGGAAGAVAGGVAGWGVAHAIDPEAERAYWQENYRSQSYVNPNLPYDEYEPAYRYGWESRQRYHERGFDDVERDLESGWERAKGRSSLTWNQAKSATRDAWHRLERALPGDFDRDGR